MRMSESIDLITKAIIDFQNEVPKIDKNCKGYGYKYADLAQIVKTIQPILKKHDLSWTQNPHYDNNGKVIGISTHIEHTSGQYKHYDPVMIREEEKEYESIEEFEKLLELLDKHKSNNKLSALIENRITKHQNIAQDKGTDITYARRYSLICSLGLVVDMDTDGVKETQQPEKNYSNNKEYSNKKQTKTSSSRKQDVDNMIDSFEQAEGKVTNIKDKQEEEERKKKGKAKIMMICNAKGIKDDERYEITHALTGKKSLKELTANEMVKVFLYIKEGAMRRA